MTSISRYTVTLLLTLLNDERLSDILSSVVIFLAQRSFSISELSIFI